MDLLKRCSGTSFCYYTRRFQRVCFSLLAYNGYLPESMMHLAYRRHNIVCTSLPIVIVRRKQHCEVGSGHAESVHVHRGSCQVPIIVQHHLDRLQNNIIDALSNSSNDPELVPCSSSSSRHNLQSMIEHYFQQGGKLYRPTVALTMAACCVDIKYNQMELINENQHKIAVIAEMIHTASLVHDDIIDEANIRRASPTVNAIWGNKMAVLVGDYILAKTTQQLCTIGNVQVISIMAEIIADLVRGEFMQMGVGDSTDDARFANYMMKTFKKTASLFANSCKSVALLAGSNEYVQSIAYEYGRHLGIAFQLIDDMLDFISHSDMLGKPTAIDMHLGLATAPVLFAAAQYPELNSMIVRRFNESNDVQRAWQLVANSDGVHRTRELARQHCRRAAQLAMNLPNAVDYGEYLSELALSQLDRHR